MRKLSPAIARVKRKKKGNKRVRHTAYPGYEAIADAVNARKTWQKQQDRQPLSTNQIMRVPSPRQNSRFCTPVSAIHAAESIALFLLSTVIQNAASTRPGRGNMIALRLLYPSLLFKTPGQFVVVGRVTVAVDVTHLTPLSQVPAGPIVAIRFLCNGSAGV